ncbi:MAG TPA: hypothetical protein VHH88_05685, partial [Verrucomicrobiae bacterium]|nr:hypothetical protein [Verrucomicrobiae bacterium]
MLANGRAALSARAPYLHARAWSILTLTALLFAAALVVAPSSVRAVGTVIIQTNIVGVTPSVLAYNAGHFCPGSNTRDWWRYSGTTGARVFLTAG